MARLALTLVLVVVVITVQGLPTAYDENLSAARAGQWDPVQDLVHSGFPKEAAYKPVGFNSVRNLKPSDGTHVFGEAEYSYHSASNVDGQTSEDKGGHKVINNDGRVKEFDFTPNTELSPFPILPFNGDPSLKPSHGSHSYSHNHNYAYHTSYGKTTGDIGGYQPITNYGKVDFTPVTPKSPEYPLTFNGVRNLKPPHGGQVYGEAQYAFQTASNINGHKSEDQFGHKVINNNGHVKEFDFTPSTVTLPVPAVDFNGVRNLKPPHGGQVYGEAQYAFHTSSNINGQKSEDKFGHKVINNNGHVKEFDFTPSTVKLPVPVVDFNGVRNLKPPHGGQVYGEAQYAVQTASNINGQKSEDKFGHKVINNNGHVKEFDFTPSTVKLPVPAVDFNGVRNLKPPHGGQVYGEAQYAVQATSNINGQKSEDKFGHKVINNNGKVKEFDFIPSTANLPQKQFPLPVLY